MNLYCLYCLRQQWYLYWYQECPCCSHTKPKHLPIYFQINIYFMYLMMQFKKKGFDRYFLWNSLKQRSLVPCYEWLDMASCLWYMSHSKRRKKKVNLEGYDILPWEMGAIWLKKILPLLVFGNLDEEKLVSVRCFCSCNGGQNLGFLSSN